MGWSRSLMRRELFLGLRVRGQNIAGKHAKHHNQTYLH
jgi:hypothetical protein